MLLRVLFLVYKSLFCKSLGVIDYFLIFGKSDVLCQHRIESLMVVISLLNLDGGKFSTSVIPECVSVQFFI